MTLTETASGHLSLDLDDAEDSVWTALELHLRVLHGLERVGSALQHGSLILETGYDHWSGYYLMAVDAEGDQFLTTLYTTLLETTDAPL